MIEDVIQIHHNYPFDPTYGYSLKTLLQVRAPAEPAQYREFWMRRYERALQLSPEPKLSDSGHEQNGWRIFDLSYTSTNAVQIGGWFLLPVRGSVRRGIIIGHGYGGRDAPDLGWSIPHTALLFPCFRGFGRSPAPRVSSEPRWHVLHDVEDREKYILGGCVEDLWLAVSALVRL